MRASRLVHALLVVGLIVATAWLLGRLTPPVAETASPRTSIPGPALHLGLVAGDDVLGHRDHLRQLANRIESDLDRRIALRTCSSWHELAGGFESGGIDLAIVDPFVAFVGAHTGGISMIACAQRARPETGLVIVRADSDIRAPADLVRGSIAMVREHAAGELYGTTVLIAHGLQKSTSLQLTATGAEVAHRVASGAASAGVLSADAAEAHARTHPDDEFRVLLRSDPLPGPIMVIGSGDVDVERLLEVVLTLGHDDAGRLALETFGATGFAPISDDAGLAPIAAWTTRILEAGSSLSIQGLEADVTADATEP